MIAEGGGSGSGSDGEGSQGAGRKKRSKKESRELNAQTQRMLRGKCTLGAALADSFGSLTGSCPVRQSAHLVFWATLARARVGVMPALRLRRRPLRSLTICYAWDAFDLLIS